MVVSYYAMFTLAHLIHVIIETIQLWVLIPKPHQVELDPLAHAREVVDRINVAQATVPKPRSLGRKFRPGVQPFVAGEILQCQTPTLPPKEKEKVKEIAEPPMPEGRGNGTARVRWTRQWSRRHHGWVYYEVPDQDYDFEENANEPEFDYEEPDEGDWYDPHDAYPGYPPHRRGNREALASSVAVTKPKPIIEPRNSLSLYQFASRLSKIEEILERMTQSAAQSASVSVPKPEAQHIDNPSVRSYPVGFIANNGVKISQCAAVAGGVVCNRHVLTADFGGNQVIDPVGQTYKINPVNKLPLGGLNTDLVYVRLAVPSLPTIKASNLRVPIEGEDVGIFDTLNSEHSLGRVASVGKTSATVTYSSREGCCGAPVVAKADSKVVGFHSADSTFVPITEDMLLFFRNGARASSPATSTAASGCEPESKPNGRPGKVVGIRRRSRSRHASTS